MKMRWMFLIAFALIATVAGAQVLTQGWKSMRVGPGTEMNLIECHDLAFTGDTSSTATTAVTGTYYVSGAWKSTSADQGKWTLAAADGVLTATAATATTGTLSVMIFGAP